MSHDIVHPEGWLPAKGYANGVMTRDGHLFVGGQTRPHGDTDILIARTDQLTVRDHLAAQDLRWGLILRRQVELQSEGRGE